MINYTSTRNGFVSVDGATALLDGFAPDGGLYVPQQLPALNYTDMLDLDYAARVEKTLRAFFDFDVNGIAKQAFDGMDDPAPTVKIDDNAFVSELWHGDTHSSKDLAFKVMRGLVERAKAAKNITATTLLIVATSGDMGKAVAHAFDNADGIQVCVLYPKDGLSEFLLRELKAINQPNVAVVGVSSDFDELQSTVKAAFSDEGVSSALGENNITLTPANSVNIGAVVPQIAYYFSAYCDLVNSGEIKSGDKIDFVIPVGNFGGMIAGYYAQKMGLPINKLVVAAMSFTALTDFIDSGAYDINRISSRPAAPVLGNIERLIFGLSGCDAPLTARRMDELKSNGRFTVTEDEINALHDIFAGGTADMDDAMDAIADLFEEYGYLADTHTAAACAVAFDREFVRPTVALSISSPYRSAKSVMTALGEKIPSDGSKLLRQMEDVTALPAPEDLIAVFSAKQIHTDVIPPQDIIKFLTERYCKN
ncbi:MAG: pyridoxal-phosphate dependent enzyme [Clostridiales bacterium]|nr:pyridoxal-phosphate dependent enzyme [Clostridiales bacterium]